MKNSTRPARSDQHVRLHAPAAMTPEQLKPWRRAARDRLLNARVALPADALARHHEAIDRHLERGFPNLARGIVAFCWPYKNEYDARFLARRLRDRGAATALPVVVAPKTPLIFREWHPGVRLERGVYDIPYPVGSREVQPDTVLLPMLGFDDGGYRLGYGGGFFDRTLAAAPRAPVVIGVAHELAHLDTIYPQPYDIPMDWVVTERGVYRRDGGQARVPRRPVRRERERAQLAGLLRGRGRSGVFRRRRARAEGLNRRAQRLSASVSPSPIGSSDERRRARRAWSFRFNARIASVSASALLGSTTSPPQSVLSMAIRPPRRSELQAALVVAVVVGLVGVDEGEVEGCPSRRPRAGDRASRAPAPSRRSIFRRRRPSPSTACRPTSIPRSRRSRRACRRAAARARPRARCSR